MKLLRQSTFLSVCVITFAACGSGDPSSSSESSQSSSLSQSSRSSYTSVVSSSSSAASLGYVVESMDTGVWYSIENSQSDLAFDILDFSVDEGGSLVQWNATGSDNQQFRFVASDENYYRILGRNSNLVLDVYEFNEADGADIVQWEDLGGFNQQFQVQKLDNGLYRFVNRLSGKALVPENSSGDTLTRITQETPSDNPYQQWRLVDLGAYSVPSAPEPGEVGECGQGDADAIVTGSPGNYLVNGSSAGGNYFNAINSAINSLTPNRSQQEKVSVRASGDLGTNSLGIPSNTIFEVCGTVNVGNVAGRGSIRATGVNNVSIPHLKMTGSPYFGLEFWGVNNLHLGQLDLRFSGGLGIRFQRDRAASSNVRMDYIYVSGTGNHGVETWNVDGLEIGTVVARDVGYAGLLLNNTRNAHIGLVDGDNVAAGTGYATMRFANTNGRVGNDYPTNIYVDKVVSRGGGRGIFCVSQSGGVEINSIDLAGNGNNSILIENCYNVKINGGTINGGGELRLAARSEFANNRDITISNVTVTNTSVRESPCGENVVWQNVNVQGGAYNTCN